MHHAAEAFRIGLHELPRFLVVDVLVRFAHEPDDIFHRVREPVLVDHLREFRRKTCRFVGIGPGSGIQFFGQLQHAGNEIPESVGEIGVVFLREPLHGDIRIILEIAGGQEQIPRPVLAEPFHELVR